MKLIGVDENGFIKLVDVDLTEPQKGEPGLNIYEFYKQQTGWNGSPAEFFELFKGKDGKDGKDYEPPVVEPEPEPEPEPVRVFKAIGNTKNLALDGRTAITQNAGKDYSFLIDQENPTQYPEMVFEVRKGDVWPSDLTRPDVYNRSEIYFKDTPLPFKKDVFIDFDLLLEPGEPLNYVWPKAVFFFNQFKATADKDDHEGGPMVYFSLHEDFRVQLNSASTTEKNHKKSPPAFKRAEAVFQRGKWINFKLRVVLDPVEGELEWFADGNQICNIKGIGTCFNDDKGPYYKTGLYRPDMEQTTVMRIRNLKMVF